MPWFRSALALLALYVLLTRPGSCQGTLLGTLVDATSGGPIGGATIEVHEEERAGRVFRSTSDSRGQFRVRELAPGTYWLLVSRQLERRGFKLVAQVWATGPDDALALWTVPPAADRDALGEDGS